MKIFAYLLVLWFLSVPFLSAAQSEVDPDTGDEILFFVSQGGMGKSSYDPAPDKTYSYMYEGVKGQTYYQLSNSALLYRAYLGASGGTAFTTCPTNITTYSYMYEGTKGQDYYQLCTSGKEIPIYRGGENQSYTSTCPDTKAVTYMYEGVKGQTYYQLCSGASEMSVSLGGVGHSFFTTCPDIISASWYFGGEGSSSYNSCKDSFVDMVTKGGEGESFYTTCPSLGFTLVSRGGEGQTFYNSCPASFVDLVTRGGIGQSFYTTCPDNLFGLVSLGGIGQTAYNSCPDNFIDRVSKGGIGQSFYNNCYEVISLFIYKTVADVISCTGRTNLFTITLENKDFGIHNFSNVIVRDSLGLGLTYKDYTASSGTYDPTTGIWTVPSIEKGQTHTLTLKASSDAKGELSNYAWIAASTDYKSAIKDVVSASVLSKSGGTPRSDVRALVCAEPQREINLSSFIDTLFQSTTWKIVNAPAVPPASWTKFESGGIVNTGTFEKGKTYSYRTRVEDECLTDTITTYVKVLNGNNPFSDERTVTVCCQDEKSLNISAILGLEAGEVEWNIAPFDAANYLTTSSKGAKVYNVEKAYFDTNIPYFDHNGGIANAKEITFYYKVKESASCLANKTYTLKLIITNQLLP